LRRRGTKTFGLLWWRARETSPQRDVVNLFE
jgi:hypothetical protein